MTNDMPSRFQPSSPLLRPASHLLSRPTSRRALHPASPRSRARHRGSTRLGLGLVEVQSVPVGDPSEALIPVAEVPEERRFCPQCNRPVGRARNWQPGLTEGYCPHCRHHYCFVPRLQAGDSLAGRYLVHGALAYGGTGWIYLARDETYNRWVVLKGLAVDLGRRPAAAVEKHQFLAELDHRNLVQVYDFAVHDDTAYVVMEFAGGKSLRSLLRERRLANQGGGSALPVDEAIAYTLGVLPALGYLHDHGLVYCDLKPENVVLTGDSLKLIELGGIRRMDDYETAIYGTLGYQAPEVAEVGPSVASDLYTVGRTLAVLVLGFRPFQTGHVDRLPSLEQQPLLGTRESLHRFLLKATAPDPAERFGSADEMAEQLAGILREEVALSGEAHAVASQLFGPDELGVGPVAAERYEARLDWRQLPRPEVDPADPGAGFLLGLGEGDPAMVASTLATEWAAGTLPVTTETLLRLVRAYLEAGEYVEATTTLDSLGAVRDWRLWWHRALVALALDKADEAVGWLDPVYTELPGEVVPKLALAVAHEAAGRMARSAELYDRVCRTDPSYVSGAFGLARVRLAVGDRDGAVEALQRVPATSPAHEASRVAAVHALVSLAQRSSPALREHLERAAALLDQLDLEPDRRARLELQLFEAGLAAVTSGAGDSGDPGDPGSGSRILGRPLEEAAMRLGMEDAYRRLARHAATASERIALVDRANRVRPFTVL